MPFQISINDMAHNNHIAACDIKKELWNADWSEDTRSISWYRPCDHEFNDFGPDDDGYQHNLWLDAKDLSFSNNNMEYSYIHTYIHIYISYSWSEIQLMPNTGGGVERISQWTPTNSQTKYTLFMESLFRHDLFWDWREEYNFN